MTFLLNRKGNFFDSNLIVTSIIRTLLEVQEIGIFIHKFYSHKLHFVKSRTFTKLVLYDYSFCLIK